MTFAAGAIQAPTFTTKVQGNVSSSRRARRHRAAVTVAVAPSDLASGVRSIQSASAQSNAPSVIAVPGTEIMPPPAPQVPPTPTQGMDFVLEQIKAKQAITSSTVTTTSPSPTIDLPKVNLPKIELPSSLPKLPDVEIPTKDLTDSAASAASKASAAAAEAAGAVTSVVGENVQQAAAAVTSAASSISGTVEDVVSATMSLFQDAQNTVMSTTSSFVDGVETQITSTLDSLPGPIKDALAVGIGAGDQFVHFVSSDPTLGGAAVAVGVGTPAILLWAAAFGGYAGSYSPSKALEVLKSQDALLVDIRSERLRMDTGVPELKRGARGKGVALSASKLLPSIARRVRNADALAIEILGAQIAYLARHGRNTRIIIMDERGDLAKSVARAATAAGVRRSYIVDGGFKAWKGAGLPILENSTEYDANPLAIVGDAAETAVEEATAVLTAPSNAVWTISGATLAIAALINYHVLLRFIGVVGIEATIAWRVFQYDSPQDFFDDLNTAVNAIRNVVQIPLALAEKVSATLPSSQTSDEQQEQTLQESSQ